MRAFKLCSLIIVAAVLAVGLASAAGAAPPSSHQQTYTVLVGLENPHAGVGVMAFFPADLTVHVGDTVHWVQNTNEIHTVTFLGGGAAPDLLLPDLTFPMDPMVPSPLFFNPMAVNQIAPDGRLGNNTTFVNSGLMGREAGQYRFFDLSFTAAGTYDYLCLVHGAMMSGKVTVVDPGTSIPSPNQALAEGRREMARSRQEIPAVMQAAQQQIEPSTVNPDGTMTHHVMMGYNSGQIDLMRFFPDKLVVRPGDTVVWEMSAFNVAPHTVTFLNGQPDPGLVTPVPQPGDVPPLLYINPAVLFPSPSTPSPLLRSGMYNSGLMNPVPGTTYSLVVGDVRPGLLPYLCMLHDTSGMKGTLMVVPR